MGAATRLATNKRITNCPDNKIIDPVSLLGFQFFNIAGLQLLLTSQGLNPDYVTGIIMKV